MTDRRYDCTDPEALAGGLAAAVEAIAAGRLVVLPTDTVYGVGCDAFDADAVAALLVAKGRGRQMPPPVLIGSPETLDGLAYGVSAEVRRLIAAFWPGALTIVVAAQPSLRWDLGESAGTVALRMPDHPVALDLLRRTGPLAVSSANLTGRPAPTTVNEAAAMLGPSVAVYLDAGPSGGGEASTILDCTGPDPVVLRDGAIERERLWAALT